MLMIDSRKAMGGKAYVNIICDWKEDDVWELIKKYRKQFNIAIPDYYAEDCRSARGGCVGCPLSGVKTQRKDFERYPRYKIAYLKAIQRAMDRGKFGQFTDANDVFEWWLSDMSIVNYFESKKQTFLIFEKK
jgi:phosphoadenosine phosphosulfate reductase